MQTMTATITHSPDQTAAIADMRQWFRSPSYSYKLAGPAGSGKSQVISELREELTRHRAIYLTPSAKAAWVLQQRGVPAVTLHSALMLFRGTVETYNGNEKPIFDERDGIRSDFDPGLLVVDEASMIDIPMQDTIESKGKKVLYVGDPYQLPPVGPDARLMHDPDALLTQVHRQTEGSGILDLATKIRSGGTFSPLDQSDDVDIVKLRSPRDMAEYAINNRIDQTIVAFNNTRHAVNKWSRQLLGFKGPLCVGDRLICRFNDHRRRIYNGMQFTVKEIQDENEKAFICALDMDYGDASYSVPVQKKSLASADYKGSEREPGTVEFDFGYAITCHSGQGSSFARTLVIDQPSSKWNMNRWRYTAVTRAESFLAVSI